ncbi:MAG: peptidylprolyl isomerase [Oscillospiraceae bacterium]
MDNTEYTPKQMLAEVNKAIQTVLLGGQSYKLGSRSVTRADLSLLRAMRDDLEAQLNKEENSPLMSDVVVAVFEGR